MPDARHWGVVYDAPATPERPKGDTPYSSSGVAHWVCRGWTESYAPDDASHQWMHAYYEVREGAACGICHAIEGDERRWDGKSNPFENPADAELYRDERYG
jgi:mono/diheme cytochrome c family protein